MTSEELKIFIEENLKTVYAFALSRVDNEEDAKDFAEDVIVAMYQNIDNIANENKIYAYFWGIANNTYKTYLRKKKRATLVGLDENIQSSEDVEGQIIKNEDILLIRRELAILYKEYRICTVMHYVENKSCEEIAQSLNISNEMVKYYLFKTRKMLKEGMGMIREFGEKSYNPEKFKFSTLVTGERNKEYMNLFSRRLPGQILLSCYYVPMTIREMVMELGVASVYLEDEIELLEKYDMLVHIPGGKYQTNIVIFQESYYVELFKKTDEFVVVQLRTIIAKLRELLPDIRNIGFYGSSLEDDTLIWMMLRIILLEGCREVMQDYDIETKGQKLYAQTYGVNFGETIEDLYGHSSFAGYYELDKDYYASYIDFSIFPKEIWFTTPENLEMVQEHIHKKQEDESKVLFPVLKDCEYKEILRTVNPVMADIKKMYKDIFQVAEKIMKSHSPKGVQKQVGTVVMLTLYHKTVSYLGDAILKTNSIQIPKNGITPAFFVAENTKETEETRYFCRYS